MSKTKNLYLSLLIFSLLLTGCNAADAPTDAPTESSEPSVEPFIPSFETGDCPFNVLADDEDSVECGFVTVPEDHNDPGGSTIRLAVAILKDQGDEHQPDPVLLLHGGPGEKTVASSFALAEIFAPLHPNRDLVIFDQRGVGSSEPALECPGFVEAFLANLEEMDPDIQLETTFDTWMTCRDRLLDEGINLAVYNTTQNAADVDAIRTALGYEQVNLYGASYGSHLAQAVIRDYPEAIRSAVMVSVWPLEKSLSIDQATTTSNSILRLVAACTADESCNTAYPNLEDILYEVIDRLNAEPIPVTLKHPSTGEAYASYLTGDTVASNLASFLYLTDVIPVLPQAIFDIYEGDYELMTQLSSTKLALLDATTRGVVMTTLCTDDLIGRTTEDLLNARDKLPKQLAGSADPEMEIEYSIFAICEEWPVEEAEAWVREPLVSDIPVLVLGGEFDPVTPPEYGRLVAGYLNNSYFFEFPGIGHNITLNECVRQIAGSFVINPNQAPDAGCIQEIPALAFTVPVEDVNIAFEPYTNSEWGIQGIVPVGWNEVESGIFTRSSLAADMTVFQIAADSELYADEILEILSDGFGLENTPERFAEREVNGLTWSLYTFEVQGVPRNLALAESEDLTLIFIFRCDPDERDSLYETIFLPMVDALVPLK